MWRRPCGPRLLSGTGAAGVLGVAVEAVGPTVKKGARVVLKLCDGGGGGGSEIGGLWGDGGWHRRLSRFVCAVEARIDGSQQTNTFLLTVLEMGGTIIPSTVRVGLVALCFDGMSVNASLVQCHKREMDHSAVGDWFLPSGSHRSYVFDA
jgi:hypothetical protein